MVFDYFGIIAVQYEMSNQQYSKDMQFQVDKMTTHSEMAKAHVKVDQTGKDLDLEKAKELGKKISAFTLQLMQGLGTKDEATGKTIFNPNAAAEAGFDVMLQMEKDRFFLETGVNTDAVTKILREDKEKGK